MRPPRSSVLRPLLRSMPVALLAAGGVAAVAAVWVGRVGGAASTAADLARHQQFATVIAAAVAGMSIEDGARSSLEATALYRWVCVHLRLLIVVVAFGATWVATLVALPGAVADLHVRPLAIEASGWLALALMFGALTRPIAVPSSTVGTLMLLPFLPPRWSLHVSAATSAWSPPQTRWLALGAISAAMLLAARRDPASRTALGQLATSGVRRARPRPAARLEDV